MKILGDVVWHVCGNRIACIDYRKSNQPVNRDDYDAIVEITETHDLICLKGFDKISISCLPVMIGDTARTTITVTQNRAMTYNAAIKALV